MTNKENSINSLDEIVEYIENQFNQIGDTIPDENLFYEVYKESGIENRRQLIEKWLFAVNKFNRNKERIKITDVVIIMDGIFKQPPQQSIKTQKLTTDYFKTFSRFLSLFCFYLIEDNVIDKQKHYKFILKNLHDIEAELILLYGKSIISEDYIEFFKRKVKQNTDNNRKNIANQYFQWQKDDNFLQRLHDMLVNIQVDIDFDNFKSLFSEEYTHKVNWVSVKPNMRQIAHLFHSLCNQEMIYKSQSRYINKIIADRLFINGKSITLSDLKKSYSHFKNRGKSKSQQIQDIDNIIESLKKLTNLDRLFL